MGKNQILAILVYANFLMALLLEIFIQHGAAKAFAAAIGAQWFPQGSSFD